MLHNILVLLFYVVLLSAAFVVGGWLERHEKSYKP